VPSFETVRVAAVQATPVILDADATADKVVRLLAEAADEGAWLAVLPETFVPLYPSNVWGGAAAAWSGFHELWEACARSASTSASPRSRGRSTTQRLPGAATGARGVRPGRGCDRRADLGRGDRRTAVRRGGMVVADGDLRAGSHAKRWFDAVGHYSRPDVLSSVSSAGETASVWRTTQ
jgi:hypothetical protein